MPIKSSDKQPGIVVHVCNPRTRETEAGRSQTPGPIGLYREYKARLGCRAEAMSQNDKQEKHKCNRQTPTNITFFVFWDKVLLHLYWPGTYSVA